MATDSKSSQPDIGPALEKARKDLLDVSTRSRMIDVPRRTSRAKTVEVVDELSEQIFDILVRKQKEMSFLAGKDDFNLEDVEDAESLLEGLAQPNDEEDSATGIAKRHIDLRLQTAMKSESLQNRLLRIYYDAKTFEDEQGVNILYLALGFLKWYEADNSEKARHSPLLLVPVTLDRKGANSRFRLSYNGEDLNTNLSLQAKLKGDFGVNLPSLPEDLDANEISPTKYFEGVAKAIVGQPRWSVLNNDIVLGFFSFSKFLMYKDLEPAKWGSSTSREATEIVSGLLGDGFGSLEPIYGEDESLDERLKPEDMTYVLDADGSQTIAIEEVKQGRNLVIQGPPGTGKSQTITNIIAAAVKQGKRVLFMAEKMAALEVVKRRLDNIGLGDMCLELHSHKVKKRAVLDELGKTLDLGRPEQLEDKLEVAHYKAVRDRLIRHANIMHTAVHPSGLTPYRILGELIALKERGVSTPAFKIPSAKSWTSESFQEKAKLLENYIEQVRTLGVPARHRWRGVMLKSMPQRMLRWHYRSEHHSLIAVSNKEFYESKLFIVPSPFVEHEDLGLRFHHITNGFYDRSGSRANRAEAQAVAKAVMQHAKSTGSLTLGVGAFSVAQRDAILDELELLRRDDPACEEFFEARNPAEPFFVKNLENLQGDERDVIYISVGYGKDNSGYMAMNFGPLSRDGGERRLNVLISRARKRCEVFSSITADDIDLGRVNMPGPKALKTFLTYAKSGILEVGLVSGRDFDSPFEEEVARALTSCGYSIDPQVGVAGFFIDLAVRDPEKPGRYLIGIECDGASYHSTRSVRDRDRLRQQVLETNGWKIHRIWSTDWFKQPQEQLRKVVAAIEQAKVNGTNGQGESLSSLKASSSSSGLQVIERLDQDESDTVFDFVEPYKEAELTFALSCEIDAAASSHVARVVEKVVEIEGPIHIDELVRRVAYLWCHPILL